MKNLFRFLLRQRDNLLFLGLMIVAMTMLVNGNMHQRAQAISSSNRAIGNIYQWRNDVTEFASLRTVNKDLAEALAVQRTAMSALVHTDDSVHVVVDSVRHIRYEYLTAQVINGTVHKERNYLTLDRGTLRGVHKDMGVIGTHGIVGVVREASPDFALVISILSSELTPSVQLQGTGHYGLLKWDTHDPTTASLADIAKHVPVSEGDTVVTRGSEGIFPPGIPVGTVRSVTNDPSSNFHAIVVALSEDLTRSGYVHVVKDLYKAQRDSLEAKAGKP